MTAKYTTAEEIFKHAEYLFYMCNNREKCEYEISADLMGILIRSNYAFIRREEQTLLFGIPIRINMHKQNVIKLWQEVD